MHGRVVGVPRVVHLVVEGHGERTPRRCVPTIVDEVDTFGLAEGRVAAADSVRRSWAVRASYEYDVAILNVRSELFPFWLFGFGSAAST